MNGHNTKTTGIQHIRKRACHVQAPTIRITIVGATTWGARYMVNY